MDTLQYRGNIRIVASVAKENASNILVNRKANMPGEVVLFLVRLS